MKYSRNSIFQHVDDSPKLRHRFDNFQIGYFHEASGNE